MNRQTVSGAYETLAHQFCEAIKTLSEKPENLENFESYLGYHFPEWMEKFANTPEKLVWETNCFANMQI